MNTVNRYTLLAFCLALTACSASNPPPVDNRPVRSVRVAAVNNAVLTDDIRAVGLLAPLDEARLSFKMGGVVEAMLVEEGQSIRRGQLLARLRETEIRSATTQAREAAAKATRDLERGQALFADGVATRENLDDLTTAARVSAAQLQAVEFNARYARIEAPADGVVLQKLVQRDELVPAGQPVLVVGGTNQGWVVKLGVADREVVQLRPGLPARLQFDAYPGRDFLGEVRNVARAADPVTGTFQIEVMVKDTAEGFARGMVARAWLPRAVDVKATPVPVVANTVLLEASADRAVVMVVEGDVVQRREVRVGRLVGERVEVLEGLRPGEWVVVDGASFVTAGDHVTVRR